MTGAVYRHLDVWVPSSGVIPIRFQGFSVKIHDKDRLKSTEFQWRMSHGVDCLWYVFQYERLLSFLTSRLSKGDRYHLLHPPLWEICIWFILVGRVGKMFRPFSELTVCVRSYRKEDWRVDKDYENALFSGGIENDAPNLVGGRRRSTLSVQFWRQVLERSKQKQ